MKLGFDIHGVIDTFPVFQEMIKNMVGDNRVEIHVISGLSEKEVHGQIGHLIPLDQITGYFSIADYLSTKPGVIVEWRNGMPWADEEEWNKAKAAYCVEKGIDIMFDDSPMYAKYFDDIPTIYCQIHNVNRKRFKTR